MCVGSAIFLYPKRRGSNNVEQSPPLKALGGYEKGMIFSSRKYAVQVGLTLNNFSSSGCLNRGVDVCVPLSLPRATRSIEFVYILCASVPTSRRHDKSITIMHCFVDEAQTGFKTTF